MSKHCREFLKIDRCRKMEQEYCQVSERAWYLFVAVIGCWITLISAFTISHLFREGNKSGEEKTTLNVLATELLTFEAYSDLARRSLGSSKDLLEALTALKKDDKRSILSYANSPADLSYLYSLNVTETIRNDLSEWNWLEGEMQEVRSDTESSGANGNISRFLNNLISERSLEANAANRFERELPSESQPIIALESLEAETAWKPQYPGGPNAWSTVDRELDNVESLLYDKRHAISRDLRKKALGLVLGILVSLILVAAARLALNLYRYSAQMQAFYFGRHHLFNLLGQCRDAKGRHLLTEQEVYELLKPERINFGPSQTSFPTKKAIRVLESLSPYLKDKV